MSNKVELLGQMIEGCSKILNSVAQDHRNFSRHSIDFHHIIDRLACLIIALDTHSVGLCCNESMERRVQVSDVLVGPLDFLPYSANRSSAVMTRQPHDQSAADYAPSETVNVYDAARAAC